MVFETSTLLPFLSVATERYTDKYTFSANLELQSSLADLAGTASGDDLAALGRPNADREFYTGKFNLLYSIYLEPLSEAPIAGEHLADRALRGRDRLAAVPGDAARHVAHDAERQIGAPCPRRGILHHCGGAEMTLLGHVRSGRSIGANGV